MAKKTPRSRQVRFIRSRIDRSAVADPLWLSWFLEHVACPRNDYELGRGWRAKPAPIDVVLSSLPEAVVCGIDHAWIKLFDRSFAKALGSHLNGMLVGSVKMRTGHGRPKDCGYVSVLVPPNLSIDPYRAKECVHEQCPDCGAICSLNWAQVGIVERTLEGKMLWGSESDGAFHIDEELAKKLDLRKRFPDLMLVHERVIPEALDGDILPGDPGWDGVFRIQVKKAKPFQIR